MRIYRDNGKENGNCYSRFRVEGLGRILTTKGDTRS